jgi:hypothetical protein
VRVEAARQRWSPRRHRGRAVLAASALALCSAALPAISAEAPATSPKVKLEKGLVTVVTLHGTTTMTAARNYGVMDTENLFSIVDVQPDALRYSIRITAPADTTANADLAKYLIKRTVRRQDLATAERFGALQGSDAPEMLAGQTFNEVSTAVLNRLKTQGETPFVFGMRETDQFLGGLAAAAADATQGGGKTGPPLSGVLGLLAGARHYYRGTLRRKESADVPFPVLFNGTRVNLPAVHAAGTFAFGSA